MPPLTYRITTLGCRVNHAETREIESLLRSRGLAPAGGGDGADLEVVHSCSVTRTAAAKSRRAARRAGHRAPHVILTGCFAATNPEESAAVVGGRGAVVPHEPPAEDAEDGSSLIDRVADHLDGWLGREPRPRRERPAGAAPARLVPLPVVEPTDAGRHVRAELRIQDGCDAHCTFCIIPSIRRTLRSKTVADAVDEARRLVALGHREIVLTGIFIGAYGHETALRRNQTRRRAGVGAEPLADLVDAVAAVPGLERLRVSSMEPGDVGDALLDAMVANAPVVVPHLHLPLQSGSDRVLRRMNRQYDVAAYLDMIERVAAAFTRDGLPPAVTTDVICGFPGETGRDFERTVEVARRVGFLHMHVFPYSARAGTAAARWTDHFVDEPTKRARVRRLIDLETAADGLSLRFRRRLLGRTVRVILEQPAPHPDHAGPPRAEDPWMTGRCDHYALVHVRVAPAAAASGRGRAVDVRITGVSAGATTGEIVSTGVRLPVLASVRPAVSTTMTSP
jgi:threonylcarbamoyladenosine tRNA methylthiotransferase MtaB